MGIERSGYGFKVPELQAAATLDQAAAVQNTWYTILDTVKNVKIIAVSVCMVTLAEDLEVRVTIDGNAYTLAIAAAVAGSENILYMRLYGSVSSANVKLVNAGTNYTLLGYSSTIEARSLKVEVRKTTANGANNLRGAVLYEKW